MKQLTLSAIAVICFLFNCPAQDKLPSFGKIDKAELELKDCSFDPGAEAMVLFQTGDISFTFVQGSGWSTERNMRVRMKVFKEKAIHYAEVKLRYFSLDRAQYITNVAGVAFNLDDKGNVEETRLEKSGIYDKSVNKEYSELSFAIPNVKQGSVFEFRYKIIQKGLWEIPAWYFQRSIPVRYSAYNVVLPSEYFEYTILTTKRQELKKIEGGQPEEGTWYLMRDVPGLKDEPFSYAKDNYLQRIEFQLSRINAPGYYKEFRTTWAKITEELLEDEDFSGAYRKNLHMPDELEALLRKAATTKDKVRAVYEFVQRNMEWNGTEGIYADKGIKDAWDKKSGSVADINFILLRWLRDAGVKAQPLLVSTKENGPISVVYPFLRQFNQVMVFVADGGSSYVLDAADKVNAYDLIPADVLYTRALVVAKPDEGGGVAELNNDRKYISNIFFNGNIEADGQLSGQARLNSIDYARCDRMDAIKDGKLKATLEDNGGVTIRIDSVDVQYQDDITKPLEQNITFHGTLESSGEYYFLPFNLFTGMKKNPFVQEERVMEIDLDYPQSITVTGTYIVPDNMVVSELPKNTKMIMPDTSIILKRIAQQDGNIVSFRISLEIQASGYTVEGYPYLKQFYTKMYEMLEERIVLKKK